jgi:hypothetical protein
MSKRLLLLTLWLTFGFCGASLNYSFAANRVIHVVLVRTAETNGSKASTATAAGFKSAIDTANIIWAGSGIQFKFDPVLDFPPIVNDTLLHHDFMLAPGQSLNQPKDKTPQISGTLHAQAKNNFVRKNYWDKLVVFSGLGDQLEYSESKVRWQIVPRTYAYSNMLDLFVQWFNGDASNNVFAHEVGHHLHLYHTHGSLPTSQSEFAGLVQQGITQWGYTQNNVATLFDGDASAVSDTPADPGPDLWKAITGDPCGPLNQISIPVTLNGSTFNVNFNTDRRNIMSYFKECPFSDGHHLSAEQAQRARESLDYGNRQHLINPNPGFLVPQWSPEIKAVSWAPGRLDLFATGADLKTVHKAYDPSLGWVPALQNGAEQWDNMGGKIIGKPAAVAWGPNRLDVFVRGTDNQVYHKAWDGSAWYPGGGVTEWENLGGTLAGNPVAVSWSKERLDVFGRGFDGQIHHKWWSPQSGWGPSVLGWEAMGGKASSDPVVTSWGSGRLDMIIRGYDGAVYHKAFAGSWYPSLTEWSSLGGSILGEPSMTSWSANRLDIVARGVDNQVYHKAWNGQAWYPSTTGWSSLGGQISSKPSMVSWGAGRLDIVAAGSDTQLYLKSYQEGSGWYPSATGWSNLGGWILPGSAAEIVSWKAGRLDLFIRNSNYAIQHKAYDSQSGWYPGLSLWEDLGKYVE